MNNVINLVEKIAEKQGNKFVKLDSTSFKEHMDKLVENIYKDYDEWCDKANITHGRGKKKYVWKMGKKYVKVDMIDGQTSVWGFVVATHNDNKFKFGDILLAAGYNKPARNKARGNIFTDYNIRWTGPLYLI